MTTFVAFVPSLESAPQFQALFDGTPYNVTVTWNLFSQRYYINITDQSGNLILCIALIGSPDDYDISMTKGYFASTLIYRVSSGNFEISP